MTDRRFKAVPWSLPANIYEVNLRQYTAEGSFAAFGQHLPRLRDMGVDILWFMPITPISVEKRLGTLGSYYACSSYTKTNPEFGTIADFTKLVADAHALGFKVIIDWVANHTGWDHEWTVSNPGFYKRNKEGNFYDSHGWDDVIDLNYYDQIMRKEMVKAMRFWVETCGIDGFRCDMAHLVPLDFWRNTREELDGIKPLFWLAESDDANYFEVFDTGYAWNWMHRSEKFMKENLPIPELLSILYDYQERYDEGSRHLFFTTNHDENSWNGTEYEKYRDSAAGFAVFSYTWPGMPLVYSGQEMPNHKRLKFFEKDPIEWSGEFKLHKFYKALNVLRNEHPVFREYPTRMPEILPVGEGHRVLAFASSAGGKNLITMLNFSANKFKIEVPEQYANGPYQSVLDDRAFEFKGKIHIEVEPWDTLVLSNHK